MKNVEIYDIEYEILSKLADEKDTTIAEIIYLLCDECLDEVKDEL